MDKYIIVSYQQLRDLVSCNWTILWVGSDNDSSVLVRLSRYKSDIMVIVRMYLSTLPSAKGNKVITHNEATSDMGKLTGSIWQRRGWLRSLRIASIYGINPGGACEPGLKTTDTDLSGRCVMGYDIEVSQKFTENGSFVPMNSPIISIALWCSCGYCEAWTTVQCTLVDQLHFCSTSSDLVVESTSAIARHSPVWLVGYNNYKFDNCVMAYHMGNRSGDVKFRYINSGDKVSPGYQFYADIVGVNNVDLYTYLDKNARSKYDALSLGSVAEYHMAGKKTQMPTIGSIESVYKMIEYNINDSLLTSRLWNLTGTCSQILKLCSVSKSPVVDCVRYVSGTMASCAISSHCISSGNIMDWSPCNLRIGYEGGSVMEPSMGIHRSVVVVDFSSMYPTIIRDVGISPENIEVLGTCSGVHEDKLLWFNDRHTLACIKGKIIRYNMHNSCIARDVLDIAVSERSLYKRTDPDLALAFKILANSLYGAFGYANSPLHSPRAAATVTLMGRVAWALSRTIFEGLGLTVIYGDTDSCMVVSGKYTSTYFRGDLSSHMDFALAILHRVLGYTPMPRMSMSREAMYKSILLIGKKHYAYMDYKSELHTKGLSSTRKDRLGICRMMTTAISTMVLSDESIDELRMQIGSMLNECYSNIESGHMEMRMISKEVRYEGNTCYRYIDSTGKELNVPVAMADRSGHVNYDKGTVYKALESDISKLCTISGLGTISELLSYGTF